MTTVVVVGEGQTEETFVRDIVAPNFAERGLYIEPRLVRTSRYAKGGALSFARVERFLQSTLRERRDTYVTTFFDLYRIDAGFPGYSQAKSLQDPLAQASALESALAEHIVSNVEVPRDRFVPHIQPYEFESVLFSDVSRFADLYPLWTPQAAILAKVVENAPSPEHINDGESTHPSARLATLRNPRYQKVLDGSRLAEMIGLPAMRERCFHFAKWHDWLESLASQSR